ncbi:hypothetical protein [Kordiimonas sp. SCSIO 12610]|uniref:hypothetical protein n=1 Tax=Kordiimonas sp. SCSIO 12610 TaxID=2829597 RepID=UPI0021089DF3|nr:hypothetical protein [Kordiimonas sp. SCSIO 12610]UTW56198.1 hypothetical protein KFF44_04680 [Kordiimonas sp. SCSIO 12610]
MNIIEIAGLDPAYRVYEKDGAFFKVHVSEFGSAAVGSLAFLLKTEVCDNLGASIYDTALGEMVLSVALTETDLVSVNDETSTPTSLTMGDLARFDNRLYGGNDDGTVIDHGPIDMAANAAVAEVMSEWDKAARSEVAKAARVWARLSEKANILALIGV